MNNKGFAVSGIIYSILILFLLLLFSILSIMGARKMVLDKLKNDVMNELNDNGESEVGLIGTPIGEIAKELVYDNDTCKTDGSTYQYMGGCYIKGNPNNNYVWYSGFLWRIMGINFDGTVRLITEENVASVSYHENSSNFDESYLNDWLNNYFYPRLKSNDIIVEQIWCSETTTSSSSARTTCTNNLSNKKIKVGLITLDEYNLSGKASSYLNTKQDHWTMTPNNGSNLWCIRYAGGTASFYANNYNFAVNPVINIDFGTIVTNGNGTLGEVWSNEAGPYILNEYKNVEVTGKLSKKATSGEYVMFAGHKYRIVDKDNEGNIKMILDGNHGISSYGSNNIFKTSSGIGKTLNTEVLNWLVPSDDETNRNKLVTDYSWYQNDLKAGNSYKVSLNETNPTRIVNATVGLIRVGEMLSSISNSSLTKGYTTTSYYQNTIYFWTLNSYSSTSSWVVRNTGYSYATSYDGNIGIRPVIVINSTVDIIGGTGIWSNPYQI